MHGTGPRAAHNLKPARPAKAPGALVAPGETTSVDSAVSTCPACHGRGSIVANPCSECHGSGEVMQEETLTVKIPQGIEEAWRCAITDVACESLMRGEPRDCL